MQPSVRLHSAFPHAACAAKEGSFLTYPALMLPTALCNLSTNSLSLSVRSLEYNSLDEQAKQVLRNVWRGAPSQLEL